jgi:eukaryotic-like serine/threonine-protein kinase
VASREGEKTGAVAVGIREEPSKFMAGVDPEEQRKSKINNGSKKRSERKSIVNPTSQPVQQANVSAKVSPEPRTSPATPRVAHAMLTIKSDMTAQIYIDGKFVGSTPSTLPVEAGRMLKVEVSGRSGASRFDKSQNLRLREGASGQLMFNIQKVRVEIRGHPSDMGVVSIDGQPLNGATTIIVYEGTHSVRLFHIPTGQLYESECEVRPSDKLCEISVRLNR